MCKKIVALLLTLAMALGCVSALAENTKHERVYAVLAADGTVQSLTDNIRLKMLTDWMRSKTGPC